MSPAEQVRYMSRQAKRFLAAQPLYEASIDYESDIERFLTCHHSWASSTDDLSEDGKAVQAYLLANPHLIDE